MVLRAAVLAAHTVDLEPHAQLKDIIDLVGCDQPWPRRIEGLGGLALHPLAAAFELESPLADVVDDDVPGNGVASVLDRIEIAGAASR